ncbi:ATP-binding cassette sub-family D member 4 [Micractinium conductrix]|uniref:ATP-binding cassette sub-family D member 4 n=1 Tax=Micractinium conductrix TaxID=554055 RepID=A0A2P6VH70_9CHLO|nr:ATP-binding cassette sub-family D member 4 [Micractinium conductrix]|eukprot:PSC73418.1 ATP-binding cassette sub-family D member 4 [Micractinium conductrix]
MLAVAPFRGQAPVMQLTLTRPGGAAPLRRLAAAARCAASSNQDPQPLPLLPRLARGVTAAAAAALLLAGGPVAPPPAAAELATVTAQQAVDSAKPLKVQEFNKGRIWLLAVLGATSLFGTTVLLENNESWFPAISRANRAMKQAREAAEARERASEEESAQFQARLAAVQQERAADAAVDTAVLEGLSAARQRSAAAAPRLPTEPAAAEAEQPAAAGAPAAASSGAAEPAAPASSSEGAAAAPARETRKPLFEISAEQIEASSAERLAAVQQEVEKRKATAAGSSTEA